MKRIITLALSVLMIVTAFTFTVPASAQDNGVLFSFNYQDKCNGVVEGKKTATTEKVTIDGVKALKIVPSASTAQSTEIRLDCYSLSYPAEQLKGVKYVTIKYRYDGTKVPTEPMRLLFLTGGGAFSKSLDLKATNSLVGGKWDVATFDVSALNERLVFEDGKVFKQFHLWPYGSGATPTGYDGQVMYISDITFHSTAPEGTDLPAIVDKPAAVTPSTPSTPAASGSTEAMLTIDYSAKNRGIVDGKKTATTEKVTIDGVSAVKITPTPDSALSSELRMDCYGLDIDSNKIKGAKYITVKYRYDGEDGKTKPMTLWVLNGGGVIEKSTYIKASESATSGGWKIATFDASEFGNAVIADQKFNHFHLWPYGQGVDPKGLSASDVMYISEISFYNTLPAGVSLPTTTEPSTPSTPSTPATPDKPVEGALEGDENGFLLSFSYQEKCNGVVDGKKTAKTEKVEIEGQKAVKITPTPDTALTSQLTLDSYSFYATPDQLVNAKYMSFKYKYVAPEGAALNPMGIRILGNANRLLTKGIDADSLKPIVNGEWAEAVFNVSQFGDFINKENKSLMLQFHLYPYGKKAAVSGLTENHVMYISDVSFYTINPDPNTPYTISFKKGHPDIEGDDPAPLTLKRGDKFTLPAMTYEIGDATFKGWRSGEDDKFYMPGAEYIIPDNNVTFTAEFDMNETLHDFLALPFIDYHNGSCDGRDNLIITEEVLQNKDVVKVVPNPTGTTAAKSAAIVDGWTYGPAGIDFGAYKYLVITYYYDGAIPKDFYLYANIMKRSILTKSYGVRSTEPVSAGKWNFAVIDFSGIDEVLVPGLSSYVLQQMHIYPFNGASVTDFKGDEALYINNLMFFKEKPDLKIRESYMKGYDGGIFKPEGNMTRAEACTIVARLAAGSDELVPTDKTTAFTDVPADQWYHKYISYVESLGYLKSYSGAFLPNQAITRAEFVELVYNMGLLKDAGKNGVFTDVAADHPKAAVIAAAGKAGLVNGYDNGNGTFSFKPDATITRAEVVKVVNNAYGRSVTKKQLSSEVKYSFNDLAMDHWAYADIMEATLSHVSDDKGWIFCMVSPFTLFGKSNDNLDYAAGEAYVKELDVISEAKKQAILNTPNMDLSKITGQKYYISNNGNDEADGKTPETAWKTIGRMVKESANFKMGDAVLFERGSLWRERFSTKSGITYTAYGNGPKPVLYGSPENGAGAENWTLLEGTTNIWVYKNELLDVGGIFCDGGKAIGLKVLADLFDGKYYVRDTKKAKEFVLTEALNDDLEFFSDIPFGNALATQKGKLYFRCDAGNPGALYSQIEFNIKGSVISNGSATDVTIDNLCIMYTGTHGIGSGTTKNLTVTNCDIGWIGGTLQNYTDGRAVRLGNGVEIYGGCDGYLVDNNYIWQCYDAGATHQFSKGGTTNISMYNATYSNNLIEDCIYNIEYFTGYADDDNTVRDGKNFFIRNNILRRSGYGWGNQRPDGNTSAHIKSWSHRNEYEKGTYIIENNIFDRGAWKLLETTASFAAWCPIYRNNTYVQVIDEGLANHAALKLKFDCFAEESIKYDLKDEGAKVYFLPTSYKHTGFLTRSHMY